jgi:hypothetical protein
MNKLEKVVIKKAFQPNINGDIFPDYVLKNIAEQINERGIIGTLGQDKELVFLDAVCFTQKAYYEDDTLYADITIMDTCPIIIDEFFHKTFTFGMRVMGTDQEDGVITSCDIIAIDIIKKEDYV